MSNATITEGQELANEFSREELEFARKLRNQSQQRQISDYRQNLRDRVRVRESSRKPPLVEGGYRTYVVLAGSHTRYDPKDQDRVEALNAEGRKKYGVGYQDLMPEEQVFRAGDRFTPLSDGEALMVDQDPGKFRWVGTAESPVSKIDEMAAEIERLKAENARKDAELADARKGNKSSK